MDVTFSESFAGTLRHEFDAPVLELPGDLQCGDLARLNGQATDFYVEKAKLGDLGAKHFGKARQGTSAAELAAADTKRLADLDQALAQGVDLRIWLMANAADLSGFVWLCQYLPADYPGTLSVIRVPVWQPHGKNMWTYRHLGELDASAVAMWATAGQPLTANARVACGRLFEAVAKAPLRAVIDGHLVAVPESMFDWVLAGKKRPRTFPQAVRLIGQVIGEQPGDLPDWWWARRIATVL